METENSTDKREDANQLIRNCIKKRKNKFVQNAKGFGKKGNFGRGTHLNEDEWSYFINIMDVCREDFESVEDIKDLSNNVLEQTNDKEIHISSNQIASTIVEYLLPYSEVNTLERFHDAFAKNLRPICSDTFASHVLQKMVEVSFLRAASGLRGNGESDDEPLTLPVKRMRGARNVPDEREYNLSRNNFEPQHIQKCNDFVVKVSKFLLNNLEDFVWDAYGNHLIRTCLMSLCGIFVYKTRNFIRSDQGKQHPTADKVKPISVPSEWNEIIKDYANRLQSWPQFSDFPYDELSSGLLQSLCLALKYTDKSCLKHLGKKLLNEGFIGNNDKEKDEKKVDEIGTIPDPELPQVFSSESAIRLLEFVLLSAGKKLITQLYAKLFCGRLVRLAEMKSANFTVQRLLEFVKQKEEFEPIFDELAPNIENLLRIGHTGVVYALAQACQRMCCKQGPFIQVMQTALHCAGSKEASDKFAFLVLKLKPLEIAEEDNSNFVHLHGSLILQALLNFNKPIKLVQCLLDTKNIELAKIFSNPRGSHVADAFLTSRSIGEKSREKFVRHMQGTYLDMAISKHASHTVEACFNVASESDQIRIIKELAANINRLNGFPTGRLLNYKLRVDTYRLSSDQWKAAMNKKSKAEKLFKDIIN